MWREESDSGGGGGWLSLTPGAASRTPTQSIRRSAQERFTEAEQHMSDAWEDVNSMLNKIDVGFWRLILSHQSAVQRFFSPHFHWKQLEHCLTPRPAAQEMLRYKRIHTHTWFLLAHQVSQERLHPTSPSPVVFSWEPQGLEGSSVAMVPTNLASLNWCDLYLQDFHFG